MTKFLGQALLLSFVFAPLINVSAQEEKRDVKNYTIEQFLKTVNYSGASFAPDNSKILVSSDVTGVFNAYSIPVGGGEPVQLTKSETDSINSISYFPNDERFLYTADQGGNELNHIYVQMPDGTSKDLTPGQLKAQFLGWSQDDKSFYVGTNEQNPRFFDIYQYDVESLERLMIFQNNEAYTLGDITPDGMVLALNKANTRDDSDIYLFDRRTRQMTHATPHEGDANYRASTFSPDGKFLYIVTDADSDFNYLVRHELESGDRSVIAKQDWDINGASFSKGGKYFTYSINQDARTVLKVFETDGMKPVEFPAFPGQNVSSFGMSSDENHVAMYVSSDLTPGNLYYMNMGAEESAAPTRLTTSLTAEVDENDLVAGQVVRFKSFDGLEVPGILYKPHQASQDNKVPALVWVHGGPGGQSRVGYNGIIQFLVNNGYAVYAINNRGSTGYGKEFEQLDNRNHGKNDLMDCVTSKRMLIETGYVDAERIGIIGGSYGGYMTLAALTFQPNEFEIGVDIFGISNWHRTVQNIPPWWESMRKALEKEMGDFDDEEYFRSISPLFHSQNIKKPLMVLQGANDPRVLKVESDEIVAAVKKNGVPVEYLVFEDEGHGFRKKANQLKGYQAILEFCDTYLKKKK